MNSDFRKHMKPESPPYTKGQECRTVKGVFSLEGGKQLIVWAGRGYCCGDKDFCARALKKGETTDVFETFEVILKDEGISGVVHQHNNYQAKAEVAQLLAEMGWKEERKAFNWEAYWNVERTPILRGEIINQTPYKKEISNEK